MSELSIRFDRVSVSFGTNVVLRNLSFEIPFGQSIAVIGKSGCGKTCILKLIVGLLQPTAGDVLVGDLCVNRAGERELTQLRSKIGYLFQGAALFDSLTVMDNVAFGLRAQSRQPEAEIRMRVQERLRDVGLPPDSALKMPADLSGGMKKRVGLARALALEPDVMLYDEPTTGLDPVMTSTINNLILQTRGRRALTSIIVTHELRTVHRAAERVLMIEPAATLDPDQPQIVYDGPPQQLGTSENRRVLEFIDGFAAGGNQ